MAASFWSSTQYRNWTFTRPEIEEIRRKLEENDAMLISQYPLPDRRLLNIYFSIQLGKLGKRMSIRQQALATAQVYMRRYYTKVDIRRTNPYLVLATAFYLACKVVECPQHIRLVVGEARQFWPEVLSSDTSQLGECEFSIISELNSQLIIHHPYRSLTDLQSHLALTLDETSLAWNIINDHYLTDLPLLYPPYLIAVTAAFLAIVMKPTNQNTTVHANAIQSAMQQVGGAGTPQLSARVQKLLNWIAESSISIEDMMECTQELVSLYEIWDGYKESVCKDPLAKFVKSRGLEK